MAAKKKKTRKPARAKTLATINLRAATLASVKAALGRAPRGPIINGFVLNERALESLRLSPAALAKRVTANAARLTGLKLRPIVIERPGTILVGFVPPERLRP